MLGTQGCKYTHRLCNTHCFSTVTMGARTRLNVTLYVHRLSCFYRGAKLKAGSLVAYMQGKATKKLTHYVTSHTKSANVTSVLRNDVASRSIAGPDVRKLRSCDYISRWAAIISRQFSARFNPSARKWPIMTMTTGIMAQMKLICLAYKKNENVKKQEHIGGCVKLRVRMTRSCSDESQVCVYKRHRASW